MDFNQYLQMYERRKQARGLELGTREAQQIFTPFFNEANSRELAGRRVDLQEKAQEAQNTQFNEKLATNKEIALNNLALERYQNDLMMQAAKTGDRNQLIGNALNTAGSLGQMGILKSAGYFDPYRRRY